MILGIILLLMIFTLTDSTVTAALLAGGKYYEANPIVAAAFGVIGQEAFLFGVKPGLSAVLGILAAIQPSSLIHSGLTVCAGVYGALMAYFVTL